jgi:hypothetical protein
LEKQTVLRGKSRYALFAEFGSKSTSIYGEYGLLLGVHVGVTINQVFSLGLGGYGKVNFTPGLPGYGGFTFAYVFSPSKKLHFRATALAGSGTSRHGSVFYIFEPGVEAILNISRIVRLQFGLSLPLPDKPDTGFEGPSINVGFQFGK